MNAEKFKCPCRRASTRGGALDCWRVGTFRHWPLDDVNAPRICSHCGGVHPDDVAALLAQGWAVALTRDPGTLVVQPPAPLREVPRMKTFLEHWTREQVARADEIVWSHRSFAFGELAHFMQ